MLIEQAIFTLISTSPEVVAITGTRIYPNVLKQQTAYPAVAYRVLTRVHEERLEPRGTAGLARTNFGIYSAALGNSGYLTAKRLDETIRLALHGYSGTVFDTSVSPQTSIEIRGIFPKQSFDLYHDPTQTHQVLTEYAVWASEVQPQ